MDVCIFALSSANQLTITVVIERNPASEAPTAIGKTMAAFQDPERRSLGSSAEQIADVVYEAATSDADQVTFVAGSDAQATYAQRLEAGINAFRGFIKQRFLG